MNTEGTRLDRLVARNVRTLLEQRDMRQAELAAAMAGLGLSWTSNTVAQVLTGRRALTLLEVAALCGIFETPLGELLTRGGDVHVPLPSGSGVALAAVRSALDRGDLQLWRAQQATHARLRAAFSDHLEASMKAAKRLGRKPAEVDDVARELWGRVLSDERDQRLREQGQDNLTPRQRQARRGHITRQLVAELERHFGEGNP